jgi:hypothetical protein
MEVIYFYLRTIFRKNFDSTVRIVARLQAGRPMSWGSIQISFQSTVPAADSECCARIG